MTLNRAQRAFAWDAQGVPERITAAMFDTTSWGRINTSSLGVFKNKSQPERTSVRSASVCRPSTGAFGATYDNLSVQSSAVTGIWTQRWYGGGALSSSWKRVLSLNLLLGINSRPIRLVFTPGAFLTLITIKSSTPRLRGSSIRTRSHRGATHQPSNEPLSEINLIEALFFCC